MNTYSYAHRTLTDTLQFVGSSQTRRDVTRVIVKTLLRTFMTRNENARILLDVPHKSEDSRE